MVNDDEPTVTYDVKIRQPSPSQQQPQRKCRQTSPSQQKSNYLGNKRHLPNKNPNAKPTYDLAAARLVKRIGKLCFKFKKN